MSRLNFIVGGQSFSISKDILDSGPRTRLTMLGTKCGEPEMIDRPRDCFTAILNWYNTGQLHIPPNVCPGEFKTELEYWNIDEQSLAECCYYKYQSFLDEQVALRHFRERAFKDNIFTPRSTTGFIGRLRARIWSVIDYRERTVMSRKVSCHQIIKHQVLHDRDKKLSLTSQFFAGDTECIAIDSGLHFQYCHICREVYFALCLLMVLLSILTMALSTEPAFQRKMTNCERLEYMESAQMADIDVFQRMLGPDCDREDLPSVEPEDVLLTIGPVSPYPEEEYPDYDDYTYIFVPEVPQTGDDNNTAAPISNRTWPPILTGGNKLIKVPNMRIPIFTMFVLEIVTLAFFTFDLMVRLSTCPSLVAYFKSLVNSLDATALICTYLHLVLVLIRKQDMYKNGWIDLLQFIQILRAFRLLRVVKNVRASRVLVHSFRLNIRDLWIICIYIIVCMCLFGSVFYITEGKSNMKSIPRAWYYTIITLTTVGYGDITPRSHLGTVLSCFCAISGLLLFAFTIPILANNFITLYKYAYMEHRGDKTVACEKNVSEKKFTEKKNNIS